ncbi:hypothetical protein [Asanoa siamensis]|uniref:Uncharacterized protein n=1 Tax=Asanoa siamensis TaxID=926357 RepID=A0ABQ4D389_9ACTN|nr:hypothetical protein [Asanoa siamensis]GIF78004.1 hypothetical protein Asi02nite_75220 [Asanoa siamensis]
MIRLCDARLDDWLGKVEPPAPYVTSVLFAKVEVAGLIGAVGEGIVARRATMPCWWPPAC